MHVLQFAENKISSTVAGLRVCVLDVVDPQPLAEQTYHVFFVFFFPRPLIFRGRNEAGE